MIVYVVYGDWGAYEGCTKPQGVFSSKEKAALFIHESTEAWRDRAQISEHQMNGPAGKEVAGPNSPDETPIEHFLLSTRCTYILKGLGVRTAGEVRALGDAELLRSPNCGQVSLREIRTRIGQPS